MFSSVIKLTIPEYEQYLSGKTEGTMHAYLRAVRQLIGWMTQCTGNDGHFQLQQLTKVTVEMYLTYLEQEGFSIHYRALVKSAISSFACFLIEEKKLLQRNPTRGIDIPPVPLLTPSHLSEDQRSILHSLIKQECDLRGAALFALGYWAGCRVSDVSWLQVIHTHVCLTERWLHVGNKGRDIDLMNEACKPLYEYLQVANDEERISVFMSQRSNRLTEEEIHYWFRTLKAQAKKDQLKLIQDLTFHNLRHDFAYRAIGTGCSLDEVARYLGLVSNKGVLPDFW
jgi:site-specific recombinase XerD